MLRVPKNKYRLPVHFDCTNPHEGNYASKYVIERILWRNMKEAGRFVTEGR